MATDRHHANTTYSYMVDAPDRPTGIRVRSGISTIHGCALVRASDVESHRLNLHVCPVSALNAFAPSSSRNAIRPRSTLSH